MPLLNYIKREEITMIKVTNKFEFDCYEAYENILDIPLFNKIISFIYETSNKNDKYEIKEKIIKKCIWYENYDDSEIKETYHFEYLGELLERYEERIGKKDNTLRTIALAVAFANELIENNMIIGNQFNDFISKVWVKAYQGDLYCKAALFLTDKEKYYSLGNELLFQKYCKTEEIIFALSVFNDHLDEFLKYQKENLNVLTSKTKTISAIENAGVFAWLIGTLYSTIFNSRKKEDKVLKALMKLPTAFYKEDSSVYKELLQNGYNDDEIAYLNYVLIFFRPVNKTIVSGRSVIEEKMLIRFCEVFINKDEKLSKNMYHFIKQLLEEHTRFWVKCYGYKNLKYALIDEINIINPVTFFELYDYFDEKLYSFNILDKKWDVLYTLFSKEKYQRIFDWYLYTNNYPKEKVLECITRYNELTNSDYLNTFYKKEWRRTDLFVQLVNKEIILLEKYWNYLVQNNLLESFNHLKDYIERIHYQKAFEFLKYLVNQNKYSMKEISDIGFNLECLVDCITLEYSNRIDINKDFLSNEDKILLFNYLDNYVFYYKPEKYTKFLSAVIVNEDTRTIVSKNDLRKIYLFLCNINPDKKKDKYLQKLYLTTDEMKEIEKQEQIEQERIKNEKKIQMQTRVLADFHDLDKSNLRTLYKFANSYCINNEERLYQLSLVKTYLDENVENFEKTVQNLTNFFNILNYFLQEETITTEELVRLICKYFKEEIINDRYINESCKYNIKNV